MSAGLTLAGVAGARGGRTLFAGVDLALHAGDAALVTGPNGIGKSSLVRIAAGLLRPAAGRVERDGPVALLGEAHALDPERPVAQALGFWIGAVQVAAALDALALSHLATIPVRLLSTGQRRRAALARVFGSAAPLWLLDEPANGLDAAGLAVLEQLVATHRAAGGIVLVATHVPLALPGAVTLDLTRHSAADHTAEART
ncbi:heme ABC exporter ATP-binding protein CcmA [Sphingomonas sp. XXL09]|uniref:heme ABC exporter ATP-binding protein CcmA n=1 Tax=Sphingomonas sp. XXL09 TaxID=3457787 RepID=UPI00406BA2FE